MRAREKERERERAAEAGPNTPAFVTTSCLVGVVASSLMYTWNVGFGVLGLMFRVWGLRFGARVLKFVRFEVRRLRFVVWG